MSIKLHLVVGDKVRNIRQHSSRKGWIGEVKSLYNHQYLVQYSNGTQQHYLQSMAHVSLEKVCNSCPITQQVLNLDLSKLEERILAGYAAGDFVVVGAVHDEIHLAPKRRVLKKVRRNVLTGRTQDDYIRDCGYATGVTQFNKRSIGLSTGQAMRLIGEAIVNPGSHVRLWDVDHAITDPQVKAGRHQLNKTFVALVESLIEKNKLVGITFDMPKQHMTFNPIVTEETYVEAH